MKQNFNRERQKDKMDNKLFMKIKNALRATGSIERCNYEAKILRPFLQAMGYAEGDGRWEIEENRRYDYVYNDMILFRYYPYAVIDTALAESENELEHGKSYEWLILFHHQGIWLLNRDIKCGREDSGKDKVVLSIVFRNNMDRAYWDYMSYDNLIGSKQDARYFADITEYKNMHYKKHKEKSWGAYTSALKRFLSYCAKKGIHYTATQYSNIGFQNFEHYVKTSSNIKTENTAKAQFFYIKGFMVEKTGVNGDFDRSSDDILIRCAKILREGNEDFVDIQPGQVREFIEILSGDRNGIRNITLLLMLMGLGMERKRICNLRWDTDISRDMMEIKIRAADNDDEKVLMPGILVYYLKQLRISEPEDAMYVFGNWASKYQVPINEGCINGMLDSIANTVKNEKGINMITPATIRRWLFFYLLKNDYRLQDIMCMMNISVDNLGNYISNQQLKCHSDIYNWKKHPLDERRYFDNV